MVSYTAEENRYETMEYNRCGKSGLQLPAISLGLWHNFGATVSVANATEMVCCAFDRGITHFDLANNYGPPAGSAEETFGRIANNQLMAYRDEMVISTKAGYYMWPGPYGEWGSKKYVIASLDQSLQRLGLDYVDIFYSHRPDPHTPLEETMGALHQIVRQGKALYIGISNYSAEETIQAIGVLRSLGTPLLIHQPSYSMYHRWVEDQLLDILEQNGVGCIAFSPLAQGLLTERYLEGIPGDSRAADVTSPFLNREHLSSDKLAQIRQLSAMARARGQTLAQMALAWALRKRQVTSVLIGASRASQIQENAAAIHGLHFDDIELERIERILRGSPEHL